MRIIHGVIVYHKQVSEKMASIGVLCDENCYIRGYVQLYDAELTPALGQQIVAHVIPGASTKLIIDSAENFMPSLFWKDGAKLANLMKILHLITTLPENMHFDGLYARFLDAVAKLSVNEHIIDEWENYIFELL